MGRSPCCDKNGLKKGPWTTDEDQKLVDFIQKNGYGNWRTLPKNAGLERCGKSCRLRWTNYLRPDIKRGRFSFEEEETIIQLHSVLGNKWSAIAARLPGRTDNEIKNYWNTHIRKRLLKMGIDPVTHNPRLDLLDFSSILNSSIYNSSQIDISRLLGNVQPLINPEFLRLASSILSSGYLNPNSNFLTQNMQSGITTPQMPQLAQHNEFQAFQTSDPFSSETQVLDQQYLSDFARQENVAFPCDDINVSNDFVHVQNYGNSGSSVQNSDQQFQEFNFPSVISNLSTPSSSPTLNSNSNTTYITEDERELSYCSSMLKFEIPDIWDASEFL